MHSSSSHLPYSNCQTPLGSQFPSFSVAQVTHEDSHDAADGSPLVPYDCPDYFRLPNSNVRMLREDPSRGPMWKEWGGRLRPVSHHDAATFQMAHEDAFEMIEKTSSKSCACKDDDDDDDNCCVPGDDEGYLRPPKVDCGLAHGDDRCLQKRDCQMAHEDWSDDHVPDESVDYLRLSTSERIRLVWGEINSGRWKKVDEVIPSDRTSNEPGTSNQVIDFFGSAAPQELRGDDIVESENLESNFEESRGDEVASSVVPEELFPGETVDPGQLKIDSATRHDVERKLSFAVPEASEKSVAGEVVQTAVYDAEQDSDLTPLRAREAARRHLSVAVLSCDPSNLRAAIAAAEQVGIPAQDLASPREVLATLLEVNEMVDAAFTDNRLEQHALRLVRRRQESSPSFVLQGCHHVHEPSPSSSRSLNLSMDFDPFSSRAARGVFFPSPPASASPRVYHAGHFSFQKHRIANGPSLKSDKDLSRRLQKLQTDAGNNESRMMAEIRLREELQRSAGSAENGQSLKKSLSRFGAPRFPSPLLLRG